MNAERQEARDGPPGERVSIRVVGGPTAMLDIGGVRVLTDPTFSPPGSYETAPGRSLTKTEAPALAREDIERVDLVLLSHDQHADNLDPAGRELLGSVTTVLSTPSAAARLGGVVQGLRLWEEAVITGREGPVLEVIAGPARHGPPGCEAATGEVTGFVIRGDGLPVVYVSGDNASRDAVQAVGARFGQIDLALLFAGAARTALLDGALLTLTSRDAAAASLALAAR